MPWARAPKAPWVEVWLSPQTMVMPGWLRPCSGPTTCTMPLRTSPMGKNSIFASATLRARVCSCTRASSSATASTPLAWPSVGTL